MVNNSRFHMHISPNLQKKNIFIKNKKKHHMGSEVLVAIIGATAAITSAIVAGVFKILETRKNKNSESQKREPMSQIKLFEKDLFSKSEYWINYTIKRLGFEQGDRNWIYETIMRNKIETISKKCKEFIEVNDLNELSESRFQNMIFTLISEIIEEYNAGIKKDCMAYFGKNKGEKIFSLVMDKQSTKESQSVGFNIWHAPTVTYMEKSIKDHCDAYYPNNVEKMSVILDEFNCAVSAAHAHLFKTFGNFNGELDHLLYL